MWHRHPSKMSLLLACASPFRQSPQVGPGWTSGRRASGDYSLDIIVLANGVRFIDGGNDAYSDTGARESTCSARSGNKRTTSLPRIAVAGFPKSLYCECPEVPASWVMSSCVSSSMWIWIVDLLVYARDRGIGAIEATLERNRRGADT